MSEFVFYCGDEYTVQHSFFGDDLNDFPLVVAVTATG